MRSTVFRRFAISGIVLCCALAAEARTRPHYGGTLRVEVQGDPWQGPDGIARRLTMDGLTKLDAAGRVEPALAIRWQSQNFDHRWQFWIREDVQFHDGTPLTSDAVAASLTRTCGSGCPWSKVYTVGPSLVFVSGSSVPDLPEQLAQAKFLISHSSANGGSDGTGAFRVTGFLNGVMTFAANDDYWGGRPYLDSVEVRPKRGPRDQWLDLSIGRADIVEVPPEMLRQARQQHLSVLASTPLDLLFLQLTTSGALNNPQLRSAIALAVDRSALRNVIFQGQGDITASVLPGGVSGYSFLFPVARDLSRAQQLRAGATPMPLVLAVENENAELHLAAERIALNLREGGIQTKIAFDSGGAKPDIVLRQFHLEAGDPRAALDELAGAIGQSVTITGTDVASIYLAERDLLESGTVVPLLWLPRAYAVSERVRDLRLGMDGSTLIGDASLEDAK